MFVDLIAQAWGGCTRAEAKFILWGYGIPIALIAMIGYWWLS